MLKKMMFILVVFSISLPLFAEDKDSNVSGSNTEGDTQISLMTVLCERLNVCCSIAISSRNTSDLPRDRNNVQNPFGQ